jgi:hypothetical protein
MVAQACNPNYLGGGDQKNQFKVRGVKNLGDPHLSQ